MRSRRRQGEHGRSAQQIELASLPAAAVEQAIADGRARGGIRDLAEWVVYLLRQRRDHDWTPPPPAPRADAPEVLGAYFAQRAAEQESEQQTKGRNECLAAVDHPPVPAVPIAGESPSLSALWYDTLPNLRLRLPRELYQACERQAALVSCVDSIVTMSVSDMRLKDTLERGYLAALRFALGDALGRDVEVRIVID